VGINRREEQRERADKIGRDPGKLPRNRKRGDESSRMQSSQEPAEDREKQDLAERLHEQEGDRE
jgi:hypothetical protein